MMKQNKFMTKIRAVNLLYCQSKIYIAATFISHEPQDSRGP